MERAWLRVALAALSLLVLTSAPVLAADAKALDPAATAWVLTATALVLFMTLPGLALFYAGLVHARNVLSVLMHCAAITCLVSAAWFVAMAIEPIAHVRTLALVELLFAYIISRRVFRERLARIEAIGIVLLVIGLVVVTLGR